jgi:diketogulonate reductase-like aldo/keto reductase
MAEGAPIPKLLYGTAWKEERTEGLTKLALEAGFRGIDTANQRKHYFEIAVGKAVQGVVASGKLTRADIFLQTKFTFQGGQDHRLPYDAKASTAAQVLQSFESSLEHFATDYLDSFVLHGPTTGGKLTTTDVEAWRAIEGLAAAGRTRFIGVSNFTLEQLRELLAIAKVPPRFLQNRCYAKSGWDRAVRHLCGENGVIYQGFSLLTANRKELEHTSVKKLAARHGRSTAELVFRFAVELGMLPLTGTSNAEHMQKDLGALDFSLEPTEVQMLENLSG